MWEISIASFLSYFLFVLLRLSLERQASPYTSGWQLRLVILLNDKCDVLPRHAFDGGTIDPLCAIADGLVSTRPIWPFRMHAAHTLVSSLAAIESRDMYERVRSAFNGVRLEGMKPIPPMPEVANICDHSYCRCGCRSCAILMGGYYMVISPTDMRYMTVVVVLVIRAHAKPRRRASTCSFSTSPFEIYGGTTM